MLTAFIEGQEIGSFLTSCGAPTAFAVSTALVGQTWRASTEAGHCRCSSTGCSRVDVLVAATERSTCRRRREFRGQPDCRCGAGWRAVRKFLLRHWRWSARCGWGNPESMTSALDCSLAENLVKTHYFDFHEPTHCVVHRCWFDSNCVPQTLC